jgi:hypothetical protein
MLPPLYSLDHPLALLRWLGLERKPDPATGFIGGTMQNRIMRTSGLAAALCGVWFCASCKSGSSASSPGGGSSSGGPVQMLCYTSPTAQVVRISAVFPIKTADSTTMMEEPWAKDFRTYIGQSGNEGGISVTCDQVTSKDAEKDKTDALRKQGHQVIETNWAYAGG